RVERLRTEHPPFRPVKEIERLEDDVLRSERNGGRIGEDALDLPPRRAPERARLAVVPGARVVDHHDPAEGEEATQAGHFTGGEVGHRLVAAEVEERGARDRRLLGVARSWGGSPRGG